MSVSEVADSLSFEEWPAPLDCGYKNQIISLFLQVASHLTEPLCKSHEFYRRIHVVDAIHSTAYPVTNLARKIALCIGVIGLGLAAVFTTVPGALLRCLALHLQPHSYMALQGASKKLPPEGSFTLLSWNICCIGAGFSISDGGVVPWSDRIDAIIDKIIETDADVNCLYETFDAKATFYLCEKLQQAGYSHIYCNIGAKTIGVSSGILVASKYTLANPEFSPFPLDSLIGWTKKASKGVFSFDVESQGQTFARIYATHLQHSEEPAFPTSEEKEARRKQMQIIADKVSKVRDRCILVTGDLNLDDAEYNASSWKDLFQKGDEFVDKTWAGDAFCAKMAGKRQAGPLNLDHTMLAKDTARSIQTWLIRTGYNPEIFSPHALSDHEGLYTKISLYKRS